MAGEVTVVVVSNTAGLTEAKDIQAVLRGMFPGDKAKVRMAFALAIKAENMGDHVTAESRLAQAIANEADPALA